VSWLTIVCLYAIHWSEEDTAIIAGKDKAIRPVKSAIRIDGFSDHPKNELQLSNNLFFNNNEKDLGLIDLFNQYQFTVEESTSTDIDVALDPELLGKVPSTNKASIWLLVKSV
jgi:hypothetical protein